MQIISVINYKGGVGKTTVTANLAGELAFRNKRVLLLDMDAQSSLTFSFVSPDYWDSELKENKTIKKWFDGVFNGGDIVDLSDLIETPKKANNAVSDVNDDGIIDLISSHLALINVDIELATHLGGANMTQSKRNYITVHGKLRSELQNLATGAYDVVLIDCPPNFNIVTKNAIVASDKILIPAKPDYLSTLGIDYLHDSVQELVGDFNEYASQDSTTDEINPAYVGIVFTMVQIYADRPIAAQRQYITQTEHLGVIPVMRSLFRENKTIFSDAPQYGLPVVLRKYFNITHSSIVREIESFVDEFMSLTGV